jgi:hypothetical protein
MIRWSSHSTYVMSSRSHQNSESNISTRKDIHHIMSFEVNEVIWTTQMTLRSDLIEVKERDYYCILQLQTLKHVGINNFESSKCHCTTYSIQHVHSLCGWQHFNCGLVWFMVFNATFNNISVISWWSVLLVEKTGVSGENHRSVASHWSHNVVSSTLQDEQGSNSQL